MFHCIPAFMMTRRPSEGPCVTIDWKRLQSTQQEPSTVNARDYWNLISQITKIAKTLGSTSIRHRSDTKVSDRCLIDVDPRVFAIWDSSFSLWADGPTNDKEISGYGHISGVVCWMATTRYVYSISITMVICNHRWVNMLVPDGLVTV